MLAVAYATGRAFHARQVKGDHPDKKGYTSPPRWGLAMRLTNLLLKKYCYEHLPPPKKNRRGQDPHRTVESMLVLLLLLMIMIMKT